MSDGIRADCRGEIYEITLDRPEAGNLLPDALIVRLGDLIESVPAQARLIALRGAGADFCAGRAPPSSSAPRKAMEALELQRAHDIVFRVYGLLRHSPRPVLALVQGRALGFGFALAAVSDLTIAADDAVFQVPEFAHNIMPTMVMSALIDRVPLKPLMHAVYSAKPMSAGRALSIGAVSTIVPAAQLEREFEELAGSLLSAPAPALLAVKAFARNAQAIDISKAVEYARALHAVVNTSSEMRPTPGVDK